MNLEHRLGQIERELMPTTESGVLPPIIIDQCRRQPTPEDEQELGPVEGWITYRMQLQAQEEANAEHLKNHPGGVGRPIFINLDVDEEYRVKRASVRSERRTDDD